MPNRMIPLYVKIAEHLRQQILNGELGAESRLPPQRDLADQFNTTLMTVRQALQVLEEENLIRTEHGVGSFVVSPQVYETNFNLLGFSSEMGERALAIDTVILSIANDINDETANKALLQPAGSRLARLERLRLLGKRPLVHQFSFLPARFTEIIHQYTPETSLYQLLNQKGGLILNTTKEVLRSIVLKPGQARNLGCSEGEPALSSLRVSFDQDGTPVIFDEAVLVADSFVVATERYGLRSHYQLHVLDQYSPDPLTLLIEND